MDISLTPTELRDLLDPWITRQHFKAPLDLDAMTDREELSAQRSLVVALADLAQAQEELARTSTMLEERKQELEQLLEAITKLKARPAWQAEQVIDRAGVQVLDLCRMFFLETGSDSWYEGVRIGLRELVDNLGVEAGEALEDHLRPQSHMDIGPSDASVPPAGFEDLVAPAVEPLEAPIVLDPKHEAPIKDEIEF